MNDDPCIHSNLLPSLHITSPWFLAPIEIYLSPYFWILRNLPSTPTAQFMSAGMSKIRKNIGKNMKHELELSLTLPPNFTLSLPCHRHYELFKVIFIFAHQISPPIPSSSCQASTPPSWTRSTRRVGRSGALETQPELPTCRSTTNITDSYEPAFCVTDLLGQKHVKKQQ